MGWGCENLLLAVGATTAVLFPVTHQRLGLWLVAPSASSLVKWREASFDDVVDEGGGCGSVCVCVHTKKTMGERIWMSLWAPFWLRPDGWMRTKLYVR